MLKTKICRLCNASYIEDLSCCEGYCKECSRVHINRAKKRLKALQSKKTKKKGNWTTNDKIIVPLMAILSWITTKLVFDGLWLK